tara:strand:- start:12996 stop:13214 length:219 start_codon:yes stop_codon:yes gene_type:complete
MESHSIGRSHISKFCGAIWDDSRRRAELHNSFNVESLLRESCGSKMKEGKMKEAEQKEAEQSFDSMALAAKP